MSSRAKDLSSTTDAVLVASRVLVSVAARSIASLDAEVTLPQIRALVVLHTRGPQNASELARHLGVHTSTSTRLCDRLVAKKLVRRSPSPESGRETIVSLSARGELLVRGMNDRRRAEVERIVANVALRDRPSIAAALILFGNAAGEVGDDALALGWS